MATSTDLLQLRKVVLWLPAVMSGCMLFALQAGRRSEPWQSPTGASVAVRGSFAFIGTYGNRVLAIDWEKGEVLWAFEDPDRQFPFMASVAVTKGHVITGGRDKRVRGLDPQSGKVHWVFTTKARVDSSPVIAGDRVFFGSSDGNVYAVDVKTGKESWRFETGSAITASPAVAGKCLVIGTEDGVLYCFGPPDRDGP